MGKSKYGVVARVVWDGGDEVRIPEELGTPREDQMRGTSGERLSELSGRTCYDSLGKGRSSVDYHAHIHEVLHYSVYEHPQMTVFVGNERMEGGKTLQAVTLVNRPGLFCRFKKDGVRLTFNPRVLLDWDTWSDPDDPDAPWLKDVLRYYGEQDWPMITPCREHRTAQNLAQVSLCSRRASGPEHEEEKWVSVFLGGSRGFSHEQVRHKFRTAVSQRSTRYVDEDQSEWVDHPLVQEYFEKAPRADEIARMSGEIRALKDQAKGVYSLVTKRLEEWLLKRGVEKSTARKQARGAARGYLGNALYTEMIFSASVAQWKRMLRLRCTDAADGEIRAIFVEVLEALRGSRYSEDFAGFELRETKDRIGMSAVEPGRKA